MNRPLDRLINGQADINRQTHGHMDTWACRQMDIQMEKPNAQVYRNMGRLTDGQKDNPMDLQTDQ